MGRMRKEVFVAAFEALSRNLSGGPQVRNWNRNHDDLYPGRESNRESPAYNSKALPLELTCSVKTRYGNGKFTAVYKKPGIGPYSKPHDPSPQLHTPRDKFYFHSPINLCFSLAISFPIETLHQSVVSPIHATGLTHLIFLGVATLITSLSIHTRHPALKEPRYVL